MLLKGGRAARSDELATAGVRPEKVIRKAASTIARHAVVMRLLAFTAEGVLFGFCASAALGFLQRLLFVPVAGLLAQGSIVAACALTGAATALLGRPDIKSLLIRADRLLGSRDLMSTAYGLLSRPTRTIYDQAILEDAAELMKSLDAGRVAPGPPLRIVKYLPIALAAIVLLYLFPLGIAGPTGDTVQREAGLASPVRELQSFLSEQGERSTPRDPQGSSFAERVGQLAQQLESGALDRRAPEQLSQLQQQSQQSPETSQMESGAQAEQEQSQPEQEQSQSEQASGSETGEGNQEAGKGQQPGAQGQQGGSSGQQGNGQGQQGGAQSQGGSAGQQGGSSGQQGGSSGQQGGSSGQQGGSSGQQGGSAGQQGGSAGQQGGGSGQQSGNSGQQSGGSGQQGGSSGQQGGSSGQQGGSSGQQGGSSGQQGGSAGQQGGSAGQQGSGSAQQGGSAGQQGSGSAQQGGSSGQQGGSSGQQGGSFARQSTGSVQQGASSAQQGSGTSTQASPAAGPNGSTSQSSLAQGNSAQQGQGRDGQSNRSDEGSTMALTGSGGGAANGGEGVYDAPSSTMGEATVKDMGDPNSPIFVDDEVGRLAVEMAQRPGDATESLARALPDWFEARTSQQEVVRQYAKQAESALNREEVPLRLKRYVRDYFLILSMLERAE